MVARAIALSRRSIADRVIDAEHAKCFPVGGGMVNPKPDRGALAIVPTQEGGQRVVRPESLLGLGGGVRPHRCGVPPQEEVAWVKPQRRGVNAVAVGASRF